MEFQRYEACCIASAREADAMVCGQCGHVLLRCPGFRECNQLVDPTEFCPTHLVPLLQLDGAALGAQGAGRGVTAKVGQRASVPLVLANAARLPSSFRVERLSKGEPGQDLEQVALDWDVVRPGEERSFAVDTGVFAAGGTARVRIVLVLASTYGGRESTHAFSTEVRLSIEEREEKAHITQHIHVEGGHFEAGASAVVQTGPSISESFKYQGLSAQEAQRNTLALQRAEAYELREGLRGYVELGAAVARTVPVRFVGFAEGESPTAPRPLLADGTLDFGRNSRERSERNPDPNDVVMIARGKGGAVDRERSLRVSGRHCRLSIENGRLLLTSTGSRPTWVNGAAIEPGASLVVSGGDKIGFLGPRADELGVSVEMRPDGDEMGSLVVTRLGA